MTSRLCSNWFINERMGLFKNEREEEEEENKATPLILLNPLWKKR